MNKSAKTNDDMLISYGILPPCDACAVRRSRTNKRALGTQVECEALPQHLTISHSASACSSIKVDF